MSKRILAIASATCLSLGIAGTPQAQAATTLPTVSKAVTCATNGTSGTFWGVFQADSSGKRRPHRGGWNGASKYNVKAIQVIGTVGGNGYTDGAVNFGAGQLNASDYTPAGTPYGAKSAVGIAVYLTFTDGKKCSVSFPSN